MLDRPHSLAILPNCKGFAFVAASLAVALTSVQAATLQARRALANYSFSRSAAALCATIMRCAAAAA